MLLTLISKGQLLVVTFFPVCFEHPHYVHLSFKRRALAWKEKLVAKDQEDRCWWGSVNGGRDPCTDEEKVGLPIARGHVEP